MIWLKPNFHIHSFNPPWTITSHAEGWEQYIMHCGHAAVHCTESYYNGDEILSFQFCEYHGGGPPRHDTVWFCRWLLTIRRADYATPLSANLALTSPTIGCQSVGIVLSRTEATRLLLLVKMSTCSFHPRSYKATFIILVFKLFISNQNYIRFYKLICCDSAWREEAYPKISPH
jgi:hypothetical protein